MARLQDLVVGNCYFVFHDVVERREHYLTHDAQSAPERRVSVGFHARRSDEWPVRCSCRALRGASARVASAALPRSGEAILHTAKSVLPLTSNSLAEETGRWIPGAAVSL
jgi:hypothetical protein